MALLLLNGFEKPAEAIAEYRTAIRIRPDYAIAHHNLGNVLAFQGNLEEAVAEYRTAIRIKPDLAEAHSTLADTLVQQGKLEEGVTEYRAAIRLKPEFADQFAEQPTRLAFNLTDRGKFEQAILAFRAAVQLKPTDIERHFRLAGALRRQGKREEAVAALGAAVRLKPDDVRAHGELAASLVDPPHRPRREYEDGLQHARKAVELAPQDAATHGILAIAEYRCGHWAESLAASERATALRDGETGPDGFFLAMAHWQNGDREQARRWFDKAVAWTRAKAPNVPGLRRWWSEAAELLGQPGPDASGPIPPATPAAEKRR